MIMYIYDCINLCISVYLYGRNNEIIRKTACKLEQKSIKAAD